MYFNILLTIGTQNCVLCQYKCSTQFWSLTQLELSIETPVSIIPYYPKSAIPCFSNFIPLVSILLGWNGKSTGRTTEVISCLSSCPPPTDAFVAGISCWRYSRCLVDLVRAPSQVALETSSLCVDMQLFGEHVDVRRTDDSLVSNQVSPRSPTRQGCLPAIPCCSGRRL
jgi:hypothetical protein